MNASAGDVSVFSHFGCTNGNRLFYAVSVAFVYLVPLAVMTVTYCAILHVALSQIRAIEATQVPLRQLNRENSNNSNTGRSPNGNSRDRKQRRRNKELKATKSVALVYIAFVVCFLPSMILALILQFNPAYFQDLDLTFRQFLIFTFFEVLPQLNSGLNPFIYSFSNKQFRNAFKRVFYKIIRKYVPPERNDSMITTRTRVDRNRNNVSTPSSVRTRTSTLKESAIALPRWPTPNLNSEQNDPKIPAPVSMNGQSNGHQVVIENDSRRSSCYNETSPLNDQTRVSVMQT